MSDMTELLNCAKSLETQNAELRAENEALAAEVARIKEEREERIRKHDDGLRCMIGSMDMLFVMTNSGKLTIEKIAELQESFLTKLHAVFWNDLEPRENSS